MPATVAMSNALRARATVQKIEEVAIAANEVSGTILVSVALSIR